MNRLIGFIAGALAFAAAHAVERAHWHDWFQGVYDPWFLNSGRAILFTVGTLTLTSAAVAALDRSTLVRGIAIAAGAFVAMTAVLFLKEGGPGTIFPIVMVLGGALLLFGSVVGAWIGARIGHRIGTRRGPVS